MGYGVCKDSVLLREIYLIWSDCGHSLEQKQNMVHYTLHTRLYGAVNKRQNLKGLNRNERMKAGDGE